MKDDVVLAGLLRFMSLGEVLQMLGANASTGGLRIESKYASEPGVIYFSKGLPVHAKSVGISGIEAAHALFGWTDGGFEFLESETTNERTINQGLMEIIMDGARMLDDGQIKELGPDTTVGEVVPAGEIAPKPKFQGIPILRGPIRNQKHIVDEETFARGNTIKSRMKAPWLHVILKGYANMFLKHEGGQTRICRLGPGALVGHIPAFVKNESAESIDVIAAGQVDVGVFDPVILKSDFSKVSYQLRRLCQSLDRRWLQVTQMVVDSNKEEVDFSRFIINNTALIEQGAESKGAFLITEGQASVVRQMDGGFIPLARLGKGDFVGDVPFMGIGHEPNAATVMVTKNFRKNQIDLKHMQIEYDGLSMIVKSFVEHIANCVTITTMVAADMISPVKTD